MKFFRFLEGVAAAQSEIKLRSCFMTQAGELLGAKAWGLDLLDPHQQVIDSDLRGLPDRFREDYRSLEPSADFISQFVIRHHLPAHNLSVQTQQAWRKSALYRELFCVYGLEHAMVAPLVGNGRLIGGVYLLRSQSFHAFCQQDLIYLSSICMHLSAQFATLRSSELITKSHHIDRLTVREQEIAEWVARGLNNREIAIQLGISYEGVKQALKRMFRKLGVSARAEMIAKLNGKRHP